MKIKNKKITGWNQGLAWVLTNTQEEADA